MDKPIKLLCAPKVFRFHLRTTSWIRYSDKYSACDLEIDALKIVNAPLKLIIISHIPVQWHSTTGYANSFRFDQKWILDIYLAKKSAEGRFWFGIWIDLCKKKKKQTRKDFKEHIITILVNVWINRKVNGLIKKTYIETIIYCASVTTRTQSVMCIICSLVDHPEILKQSP